MRRPLHLARTVERAITRKSVKQLRRATHPVDNAGYALERSLNTKSRCRSTGAGVEHPDRPGVMRPVNA